MLSAQGLGPCSFGCSGASQGVDAVFGFQEAVLKELICLCMMGFRGGGGGGFRHP